MGRSPSKFFSHLVFLSFLLFSAFSYAEDSLRIVLHAVPQATHCDLEVVATNTGPKPVTLVFNTAQRFDFYAKDAQDRIVWQWSYERVFANEQTTVMLQPTENVRHAMRWTYHRDGGGRIAAGTYRVMGALTAQPQDRYSVPVAVDVPAMPAAR